MEEGTIGRRWARALVESLEDEGDLRAVDEQLGALAALMAERGEFRVAMLNPSFTKDERAKILQSVAQKNKFHPQTQRFLGLLVEKSRLPYLSSIAGAFRDAVDHRLGRVRAVIESANELKKPEVDKIVKALKARTGKEVFAEVKTDPSLIAGMRASIGGLVLDNTVRTKIDRMRQELVS